jgi:aspartate 1-decarboxylase
VRTLYDQNEKLRDDRQQFVARIVELQTDLKNIKAPDVIRQEQVQILESENADEVRTLYDQNENLRDGRQQFVAHILELQTDLKNIKAAGVIRQEQVQILESENADEVRTLYDQNENLRDDRQQFVACILELQTDLKDIKSSDVIRQVQELQEQVLILDSENAIILLNVCLASSTWFTDNQLKRFRRWWSAQWG